MVDLLTLSQELVLQMGKFFASFGVTMVGTSLEFDKR